MAASSAATWRFHSAMSRSCFTRSRSRYLALVQAPRHDVEQRLEGRARSLHAAILKVLLGDPCLQVHNGVYAGGNCRRSCFSGCNIPSVRTASGVSNRRLRPILDCEFDECQVVFNLVLPTIQKARTAVGARIGY